MTGRNRGTLAIALTFFVALVLTVVPMPSPLAPLRPEWAALTLLYWVMALPQRIGVGAAWGLGLLLDVLKGAVLGQHALALALVVYLTLRVHRQLRVYPVWQQALAIGALVLLNQMVVAWINGIIGIESGGWGYWLPSLSSALLWPWMYIILRDFRRHFVSG